jgi:hypothetical protein
MNDSDRKELKRRLITLAPLFGDLGARTIETYARGGILDAIADGSLPVSDARFTRKNGRYIYHLQGPVYFYMTRAGELQLAGQHADVSLAEAMLDYAHLGRRGELEDAAVVEGATEWFPPPRFLLDVEAGASRLYIASVSAGIPGQLRPRFLPLEEYVEERARLFVTAFRDAQ